MGSVLAATRRAMPPPLSGIEPTSQRRLFKLLAMVHGKQRKGQMARSDNDVHFKIAVIALGAFMTVLAIWLI